MSEETDKVLVRSAILRVLENNDTKFGLDARAVATLLPAEGFNIPTSEVTTELDILLDWRYIRLTNQPLDRSRRAFAITSDGRHQL